MLQAQLAEFKKAARKINTFTVPLIQEWRLDTSKVMRNRLSNDAINNRQAAIRGMPYVNKNDAGKVMRTLLAMRGIDKKKNTEAWDEGVLEVAQGSLKLQGVAQKWRSKVIHGERWNEALLEAATMQDGTHPTPVVKSKLKEIYCCMCNNARKADATKLVTKTGFSAITWSSAKFNIARLSSQWRCRCMVQCIKCPRHIHQAAIKFKRPKQMVSEKQRIRAIYGTAKPRPPVKQKIAKSSSPTSVERTRIKRVTVSRTISTITVMSFHRTSKRLDVACTTPKPVCHVQADDPT